MKKKVKECLELSQEDSEAVSRIVVAAHQCGESSIYNLFSLKVPPRLTRRGGRRDQENNGEEGEGVSQEESEAVSRVVVPAQRPGESSIYDMFCLRGIRVDRAEPGLVVCTLKVPPRLTDRAGNLAQGAIANLVDVVGASIEYVHGLPMNVSVDISVSYMSQAKLDDELEITSKRLGRRGAYSGTIVLLRNKATGEVVAEGRHSMFRPAAKL